MASKPKQGQSTPNGRNGAGSPRPVWVFGDANIDEWIFERAQEDSAAAGSREPRYDVAYHPGGVWTIAKLLITGLGSDKVRVEPDIPPDLTAATVSTYPHYLVRLRLFPVESVESKDGRRCPSNEKVFRIDEVVGRRLTAGKPFRFNKLDGTPKVIVFYDHGERGNFRNAAGKILDQLCRLSRNNSAFPVLIWQTVNPFRADSEHPLARLAKEEKMKTLRQRMIVVVDAESLCDDGAIISNALSVDRSIKDFEQSLTIEPLKSLNEWCHFLVVRIGIDRAVGTRSKRPGTESGATEQPDVKTKPTVSAFYRPIETEDSHKAEFGHLEGYTAILTASIAQRIYESSVPKNSLTGEGLNRLLTKGIKTGMNRCARHFRNGLGLESNGSPEVEWTKNVAE